MPTRLRRLLLPGLFLPFPLNIRARCAGNSGQTVSSDGIRNQIADGLLQSASWTITRRCNGQSSMQRRPLRRSNA